jgi:hypothetical protein
MGRRPRKAKSTGKTTGSRRRTRVRERPSNQGRKRSSPELEKALRFLRAGNSQRLAARSAGVPVKRFRQFLRENKLAKYTRRRWHFTDKRRRQVLAITTRGEREVIVRGFEPASWAMSHRNAVREFLATNDASLLAPFESVSITDVRGRKHPLETRPNALYRQSAAASEHFEQIYRLVT